MVSSRIFKRIIYTIPLTVFSTRITHGYYCTIPETITTTSITTFTTTIYCSTNTTWCCFWSTSSSCHTIIISIFGTKTTTTVCTFQSSLCHSNRCINTSTSHFRNRNRWNIIHKFCSRSSCISSSTTIIIRSFITTTYKVIIHTTTLARSHIFIQKIDVFSYLFNCLCFFRF